jgi:hypothetical protein
MFISIGDCKAFRFSATSGRVSDLTCFSLFFLYFTWFRFLGHLTASNWTLLIVVEELVLTFKKVVFFSIYCAPRNARHQKPHSELLSVQPR